MKKVQKSRINAGLFIYICFRFKSNEEKKVKEAGVANASRVFSFEFLLGPRSKIVASNAPNKSLFPMSLARNAVQPFAYIIFINSLINLLISFIEEKFIVHFFLFQNDFVPHSIYNRKIINNYIFSIAFNHL